MYLAMNADRLRARRALRLHQQPQLRRPPGAGGCTHLVSPAMAAAAAWTFCRCPALPEPIPTPVPHERPLPKTSRTVAAFVLAGCNTVKGMGKGHQDRRQASHRTRQPEQHPKLKAFTCAPPLVAPMDREKRRYRRHHPKAVPQSRSKRTSFGPNLFDEWRYLDRLASPGVPGIGAQGEPVRAEPAARYQGASIPLARHQLRLLGNPAASTRPGRWSDYGFLRDHRAQRLPTSSTTTVSRTACCPSPS